MGGDGTVKQRRRPSSIRGSRGGSNGDHPLGGDQSAPAAAAAAGPGYPGRAWTEPRGRQSQHGDWLPQSRVVTATGGDSHGR